MRAQRSQTSLWNARQGVVRLNQIEVNMNNSQFTTVLRLLADGAYIEQVSEVPVSYRIFHERESAAIPGGLVQQLLTARAIKESCKVSGRMRYVGA